MNCEREKFDTFAHQINLHPAISSNAVSFMIYGLDLTRDIPFSSCFFCPSVLSIVVINIWINFQTVVVKHFVTKIPKTIENIVAIRSL